MLRDFSKSDIQNQADILYDRASKILEDRDEVEKFVVVRIREPTADGNGMLRVEDVRGRRVVDDDGVLQVSADLGEILDVVSLVVVAAFSEKAVVDDLVDVQLVQERIAVLEGAVSGDPGPVGGKDGEILSVPWKPKQ